MTALLLVDLQNDFMPGGALAVKNGDEVLPVVKKLMELPFDKILASRDWHPDNHVSFAKNHQLPVGSVIEVDGISQILWPVHCVQESSGAQFHKNFDSRRVEAIFSKGVDPLIDSYSAFFDNEKKRSTGLDAYLKEHSIDTLYIAGLTTEYCVKYSVLDARQLGLNTYVIVDGCRGIDLHLNDSKKAWIEMVEAGAHLINLSEVKL